MLMRILWIYPLIILIYGSIGYLVFLLIKTLRRLIKALDIYINKNSL